MARTFRFFVACSLCIALAVQAEDISGSRDHPLLSRYPQSFIVEYRQGYEAVEVLVARAPNDREGEKQGLEGNVTTIRYLYESPESQASPLQLIRNYQNAIKSIGGSVVYERLPSELDGGETTLRVSSGGKTYWVKVAQDIFGAPTQNYLLQIVEIAAMEQRVTANQLLDELNTNGFATLYLSFDTGKSELKDDGIQVVGEIVTLMQQSPQLVLSVEGHTDNVGSASANQALSQRRAESVMAAIVAGGIDAKRLSAQGFGSTVPVADNRSEAGRAKNRRVELVKK